MATSLHRRPSTFFSAIPIDQAHEQSNACVKVDGRTVGLTENPSALRRWMIAGPEVARIIGEFENSCVQGSRKVESLHHDKIVSVQTSFGRDVCSLLAELSWRKSLETYFTRRVRTCLFLTLKRLHTLM